MRFVSLLHPPSKRLNPTLGLTGLAIAVTLAAGLIHLHHQTAQHQLQASQAALWQFEGTLEQLEQTLLSARLINLEMLHRQTPERLTQFENELKTLPRLAATVRHLPEAIALYPDLEQILALSNSYQASVQRTAQIQRRMGLQAAQGIGSDLDQTEGKIMGYLQTSGNANLQLQFAQIRLDKKDFNRALDMGYLSQLQEQLDRLHSSVAQAPLASTLRQPLLYEVQQYEQQLLALWQQVSLLELAMEENKLRYDRLPAALKQLQSKTKGEALALAERTLTQNNYLNWLQLIVLSLGLCLLIAIALLQVRHIRRLVTRLRQLSQRMASFSAAALPPLPSQAMPLPQAAPSLPQDDEIDRLNRAFGEMAEQIQQQINLIEQERQRAQAASQTKSRFLANISHEIRTPLNGVIGMASLLRNSGLEGEQAEYAATIEQSGELLLAMLNDVLDFSRIESGNMPLEKQPFELRDCLEATRRLFSIKAADRGLRLSLAIDAEVPACILGDRLRLQQIVGNLLSNAIKFSSEGDVELLVSWRPGYDSRLAHSLDHRPWLEISVRDQGIGIAPEQLDSLFEEFAQGDASTTRKYGGSGLGLAICKRLVTLMGGKIWVQSERHRGSTFCFSLPVTPARPLASPAALGSPPAPLAGGSPIEAENSPPLAERPPLRILVAEPSLFNQRILLGILTQLGCPAQAVGQGQATLVALEQRPYDLLLLSLQMPDLDGLAMAREIRCRWGDRAPKLVAMETTPRTNNPQDYQAAGLDEVISKPVSAATLRHLLEKWGALVPSEPPLPLSWAAERSSP